MKNKDEQTGLVGLAIGAAVIGLVSAQKPIHRNSIVDELVRLGRQKGDGVEDEVFVKAAELGADDYLPKPFNDRELVARIRAILRRSHWSEQQQNTDNSSPTLEVDSLSLNPGRQEASFDGETLELTGTEFTLLYLLAQHLGQVVSREHLSQEVLGKRLTPFDRAIDMHISNLRRKLPERKDGHPWFKTLRGRGYLMVSAS